MVINNTNYKDQLLKYFQHNFKCNPIYETNKLSDSDYSTVIKYNNPQTGDSNIIISNCKAKTKKKSEQLGAKMALIKYHVISE